MSLTFNKHTGDYVVVTTDKEKAKAVGLTEYSKAKGPKGEPVFATKSPYAALPYIGEADDATKTKLRNLSGDYESSWKITSELRIPHPEQPDGSKPDEYQCAAVEYALKRDNVLFGDAPGLGKTLEAIGLANITDAQHILVGCPAVLRPHWVKNVQRWSTIPTRPDRYKTYSINKGRHGVPPLANYVICSYDLIRNEAIHDALTSQNWDMVILDEAHYLKATDAKRTQAIFGGGRGLYKGKSIVEKAKRIAALTGTPLPNRPRECFTLAKALCHESIDFMNYEEFCYRFNPSGIMDSGYNLEMKGRLPELQARLRSNFMIRRLKEDVLKNLPDKRYEMAYIEGSGAINEVLAKERLIHFDVKDLKNPFAQIWGQVSTVRREMGTAKVPRIIEHMKMLLDVMEIPKVVLFNHHREVMDTIRDALSEYGVAEVRGGMGSTRQEAAKMSFIENPDVRIFSGQLDSAGFGLDGLQGVASHVVFGEPAWTPGTNEQAIDRLHRRGQHQNVIAQFLIVEGSLDEKVLGSVFDKAHTIHGALDARTDNDWEILDI